MRVEIADILDKLVNQLILIHETLIMFSQTDSPPTYISTHLPHTEFIYVTFTMPPPPYLIVLTCHSHASYRKTSHLPNPTHFRFQMLS